MIVHESHRDHEPFMAIANGQKTIESRLYDEKRRGYQLGDTILLTDRQTGDMVNVRVVGLLRYASFTEMFAHNAPSRFGGPDAGWLLAQIRGFYSIEDEQKYGVLGIEFELIR